ncbi:MAG: addiction module protein, partial [Flavobacteriaceae bacterium]
MTALEEEILKLPKLQKISIMERIWADLSQDEEQIEIPSWHHEELERAEKGLSEGKEKFEDWDEVKKRLREE